MKSREKEFLASKICSRKLGCAQKYGIMLISKDYGISFNNTNNFQILVVRVRGGGQKKGELLWSPCLLHWGQTVPPSWPLLPGGGCTGVGGEQVGADTHLKTLHKCYKSKQIKHYRPCMPS